MCELNSVGISDIWWGKRSNDFHDINTPFSFYFFLRLWFTGRGRQMIITGNKVVVKHQSLWLCCKTQIVSCSNGLLYLFGSRGEQIIVIFSIQYPRVAECENNLYYWNQRLRKVRNRLSLNCFAIKNIHESITTEYKFSVCHFYCDMNLFSVYWRQNS